MKIFEIGQKPYKHTYRNYVNPGFQVRMSSENLTGDFSFQEPPPQDSISITMFILYYVFGNSGEILFKMEGFHVFLENLMF